jgi:hypothetical protein
MRSILCTGLCLILCAVVGFSQTDRGTITGTITDPAGAVIPGAQIEAENINTGAIYRANSTNTGNYTIGQLPAGKYQLSSSVAGFKQFMQTGITVMVAQTLRIDIKLEVGNISETVTVSADATLLRTESGELSQNVEGDRLSDLPIMAFSGTLRDPYAVTLLVPGAYFAERSRVRVGGSPANTQAIRVEGQDSTNNMRLSQTQQNQSSVDAIEEFSVQTSNYAAEYGQAGGAFYNVTMKSGTNQLHGTVYDYWVNEAFNARTPWFPEKSRTRKHNYGFTVGGPVYIPKLYDGRNKTFFFFNWEQFRDKFRFADQAFTVPTAAFRNGDFSSIITGRVLGQDPLGRDIIEGTIYDPQTDRLAPNGQRVRDPFLNNYISPDRFDPVSSKIQALIPEPTGPNMNQVTANYLSPWDGSNIRDVPALKIDHNLSDRAKLSFYWSATSLHTLNNIGGSAGDGWDTPVSSHRATNSDSSIYRLNFDYTLSPNKLLHLGAGVIQQNWNDEATFTNFDQQKELGLPGAYATIFPYMTGLETSYGGVKNLGPFMQSTELNLKPTANASFTWVKNNHTYKFGAEMRIEGFPIALLTAAYGNYNFSDSQTGLAITGLNLQGGYIGFPYASFLLGHVDNGNIGFPNNTRLGKNAWAIFAQDSWKATRRLTIDYGLRWDYQTYFKEQYGRVSNFSPTTMNPSVGLPGAVIFERDGVEFAKVYPYAFGPRLGVAYQIMPKTVIRTGVGIMYGQTAAENRLSTELGSDNPFTTPSYGDPAILLKNGPPTPAPWPNLDPGQYPAAGKLDSPPFAFDHNAGRPPRQVQWSFGIQQELTSNMSVEVSYVGNRGVWWEGNELINVNALSNERIASFGLDINDPDDQLLLKSRLDSSIAAGRGFDTPPYESFPTSATVAQSLRPFPQFGDITYRWAPLGKTWYDSLQIKVNKRFSHGLDFTSTFSWQKELTMGAEVVGQLGPTGVRVNNVFDRGVNKYISGLSRPIVFVTAVNYTTPKFAGFNRALSTVFGDWTIGAVLQLASGMPIVSPTAQSRLSSLNFQDTYANKVPGESYWADGVDINDTSTYDPYFDHVLNPNAWEDPEAGQFGVSPAYHDDYRFQRRPGEAFSFGRTFRINEGASFNIRMDFQNVFNRLIYGNPSATNAKSTRRYRPDGQIYSGFGYISTSSSRGMSPRTGVLVLRLRF